MAFTPNLSLETIDEGMHNWHNAVTENFEKIDTWSGTVGGGISLPAGMIAPFAISTPPSGWLECDGSAVSRSTYAVLFAAIGTDYGSGDGYSTFNLPDYRGWFLRGWDHGAGKDPSTGTRGDRGDGTTGDYNGTTQTSKNKSHSHTTAMERYNAAGSLTAVPKVAGAGGATVTSTAPFPSSSQGNATESRPENKNVMYCIKA